MLDPEVARKASQIVSAATERGIGISEALHQAVGVTDVLSLKRWREAKDEVAHKIGVKPAGANFNYMMYDWERDAGRVKQDLLDALKD